jgi:hypothetical protein
MVAAIQGRFYADFANQGPAVEWVTIARIDAQMGYDRVFR